MTFRASNDLAPFGRHAPRGWLAGLVRLARLCGAGWAGRRLAFALRAIGVRALGDRPLDVDSLGARMRLYPAHNVAEKNLLFTPQYFDLEERRFLAGRLGSDFVFIDVGANAGGYALFAATLAGPRARILAIEPQADIFERLSFNIRQNGFSAIKALEMAVADRDGEVTLFVDPKNRGETSMRLVGTHGAGTSVRVPAKALATLVAEEGFDRLDAVKLDVEGAEDLILEAFFRDAPPRVWPRLLIVEDAPGRWAIDLPALIAQQGYRVALKTRTNVIFER
jgi:FkbM family methyltransferase